MAKGITVLSKPKMIKGNATTPKGSIKVKTVDEDIAKIIKMTWR